MAQALPKSAASPLTIHLFGPFEARLNGEPLPRLRSRKGHHLLALLALRHDREVERAWVAGTLWPDSPEPQARASLRITLNDLRRAVGVDPLREGAHRALMEALAADGEYAART